MTGCSGGGKSALLEALARRGVRTFEEPGRIVVRRALTGRGGALPEADPLAFAAACLAITRRQLAEADVTGAKAPCVFDRSPVDQIAFLARRGIAPPEALTRTVAAAGYHRTAVFAPPWPDLFHADAERRHGWDAALEEAEHLPAAYAEHGFRLLELPRLPLAERADWLIAAHPALS